MRPEERDPAYLWDMVEACRAVMEFTEDVTLEEFLAAGRDGEMRRLAVEREREIHGEAARRVSDHFREEHPDVPWRELVGLRNVISHQYDKVSYAEIHRMLKEQIPNLRAKLESLLPPIPGSEE